MRIIPVGRRIVRHRKRWGMKQAELARLVGVGRSTLHGWENGRSEPPPSVVARIAAIFGMTEAQFYSNGPYPPPRMEKARELEAADDAVTDSDDGHKVAAAV